MLWHNMWLAITLLAVLGCVGAVMYGLTVFMLARMLTRPARLTDARALARLNRMSPTDIGLEFIPCTFEVTDQHSGQPLRLSAWWIPRDSSSRCIILLHGFGDAKIGAISWAPMMLELGWNVLAIDLRAHGQSEGRDTTAGYFERHDLSQVIDQLRSQRPEQTRQLAIFGISMGAAVTAAVAAIRDDLHGVILDSPYAHFRDAAEAHANLTGLPGRSFVKPGWVLAKWLTGANLDEVDPARTIPQSRCPMLVICATQDVLVDGRGRAELRAAVARLGDIGRSCEFPAGHVLCLATNPAEYAAVIGEFLASPHSIATTPARSAATGG